MFDKSYSKRTRVILIHHHSDSLRIQPTFRRNEIMSRFNIRDVGLEQLKIESLGCENGGEGEIKFAMCQAVIVDQQLSS